MAPDRFRNEVVLPVLYSLPDVEIAGGRQTMHIRRADVEVAACLEVSADEPVADVRRVLTAPGGLLVGEGLPTIGTLLDHNHVHTTARYAHLANDPLKSVANRIAIRIAEIANGVVIPRTRESMRIARARGECRARES